MENRRKKDLLDADYADGHGFFKDFSVRICEIRGIRVQNHGNFEREPRGFTTGSRPPRSPRPRRSAGLLDAQIPEAIRYNRLL